MKYTEVHERTNVLTNEMSMYSCTHSKLLHVL